MCPKILGGYEYQNPPKGPHSGWGDGKCTIVVISRFKLQFSRKICQKSRNVHEQNVLVIQLYNAVQISLGSVKDL